LPATTLSGYVDTSAIWNFGSGHNQAARFVNTGTDRQDGFNVDVVKLALEKPLDEGTWSAGYKTELWFGPDAVALPGSSLFGNKTGATGDLAVKQAYVALRAPVGNGLDFKLGQFDPIIGYEVADSNGNPNFSRSFGFALEPLSHTGVLAAYQFSEVIGATAGVANTAFGKINAKAAGESIKTYMAGLTVKAPESLGWLAGSSLYAGVVDGGGGFDGSGAFPSKKDSLNLYVGASVSTPIKALSLGVAYDYLANGFNNTPSASSYGNAVSGYINYTLTEKLKASVREEYATSSGGYFGGGNDEKFFGSTLTLDYSLWANVVTRAEFRWDHAANGASAIFGTGAKRNDYSLALNVIYKF
jgi:hypothetical protein